MPTLREVREEQGLTQRELAGRAKVSTMTVLRVERGRRSILNVRCKLAQALNVVPTQITWPADVPRAVDLAASLREARDRQGLSQRSLAWKANASPITVFRIEHGAPATLTERRKLAAALSLDPDAIA